MRTVSVYQTSEKHLKMIDKLIEQGLYLSRSDFIRSAIKDLLQFHLPTAHASETNSGNSRPK